MLQGNRQARVIALRVLFCTKGAFVVLTGSASHAGPGAGFARVGNLYAILLLEHVDQRLRCTGAGCVVTGGSVYVIMIF
jgi:hypothetical protein